MFGAVGEKLLLLCDMQPFSDPLEFTWEFLSVSTKKRQVLKTSTEFRNIETDKLSYIIKDEQAFGKVFWRPMKGFKNTLSALKGVLKAFKGL